MDSEHSPSVPCGGAEAWEAEVSQGRLSGEGGLAGPQGGDTSSGEVSGEDGVRREI